MLHLVFAFFRHLNHYHLIMLVEIASRVTTIIINAIDTGWTVSPQKIVTL